jgi:spore germination protein KC
MLLLSAHIRREPFLMHLGFVVFGEEMARAGIGAVLGGLHGKITIRGSVPVLVAAGSAQEVLRARSGVGRAPGADVLELLANMRRLPLGRVVTLYDAVNTLSGLGGEIALPILDLAPLRLEAADHQPADGTGQQGQQLMEVTIGRTALFVRDRWVHDLDVFQTQALTLLSGDVTQGALSIAHPTAPGGAMALQFLRFRAQLKPEASPQGPVALQVKIEIDASLTETRAGYDLRQAGPQPILEVVEQYVTAQVTELFALMQEIGSDSLGVGNMIYRNQPRTWSHLEPRWSEHYRQMTVSVDTKARLKDTSMLMRLFAVRRE